MNASIVGYGETDLGKVPGYNGSELSMWAAGEAMNDAGITPQDVDGLIIANQPRDRGISKYPVALYAEYLGVYPIRWGGYPGIGGASYVHSLAQAVSAVESGLAETVLIVAGDRLYSGRGREAFKEELSAAMVGLYEEPSNITPSIYAMIANRHMAKFGTTPEQLAKVAEIDYTHAAMQKPARAHLHESKTVTEILDSPMIADPLTMRQCALVSDGGAAVIISGNESIQQQCKVPITLSGFGSEHTHERLTQMPNFEITGAQKAGKRAMEQADVTHEALDTIHIYDCFTINALSALENLGFCPIGQGGELVESGELELGGKWPMNTHGGSIAGAHPGPSGLLHVTEAVRQLRGEAESTQVDGASTSLVYNTGGVMSGHSVAVLERGDGA